MHRFISHVTALFITLFVFGISLLCATNLVYAVTINIYPTEDTYIDSDYPNDNYVGAIYLDVYKYVFSWGEINEEIGLLKFNLANQIPTGATVNSAVLRLIPFGISSTTPTVGVYKFSNNNWDPVTTTWNNFTSGTYQHLSSVSLPYEDQYYYWNVLPALNNDVLSLAVKSTRTASGGEYALFSSLNISTVSERPVLIIDYLPPPVCTYTIGSSGASYTASGGSGSVSVTVTDSRCTWTATSNTSWITVTGGSTGLGNGTVNYQVAFNNTGIDRTGTLTIAGETFTVSQAKCTYSVSPLSVSFEKTGGEGSISVMTTSGCTWTAVSNASWITLTLGSSGTSNGTVTYKVTENTEAARKGTITVAGQTVTVKQKPGKIALPWLQLLLE